jgi:hypothetical protein
VCKRLFEERANDGDGEIFGTFPFPCCTRGRMAVRGGPARLPREPKPSQPPGWAACPSWAQISGAPGESLSYLYRGRASTRAGWRAIGVHGMLPG